MAALASPQRDAALKLANERRRQRKQFKAQLRTGESRVSDLLSSPLFARDLVIDAIRLMPRVGDARAMDVMRGSGVHPFMVVGRLTVRQREEIARRLP